MAPKPTQSSKRLAPAVHSGVHEAVVTTRSQTWDAETRTFEFILATESPVRAYRWDDWDRVEVDEQLDMSGLQDIDRLRGQPILDSHNSWSIHSVVGVIESARIEGGSLVCVGRLSSRTDVDDIASDVADGILTNVSVGFEILEEVRTTRPGEKDLVKITKWRAREASLVAVPADANANIRSNSRETNMSQRDGNGNKPTDAEPKFDPASIGTIVAEAVRTAMTDILGTRADKDDKKDEETEEERKKREAAEKDDKKDDDEAAVRGLRAIAERRDALDDFDDLVLTGADLATLRTFTQGLVSARAEEIKSQNQQRGITQPAKLMSFEDSNVAKRASERLGKH